MKKRMYTVFTELSHTLPPEKDTSIQLEKHEKSNNHYLIAHFSPPTPGKIKVFLFVSKFRVILHFLSKSIYLEKCQTSSYASQENKAHL